MGYFRNPEIKKEGIIWLFAVLLTAFFGVVFGICEGTLFVPFLCSYLCRDTL